MKSIKLKKRILIVEKEAVIALYVKLSLERKGYKVIEVCNSCKSALNFLKNNNIDLVLLNLDTNGKEVCNYLDTHNIPVLYIVGNKTELVAFEPAEKSPAVFLKKPFTENQLLEGVNSFQMST